MSTKSNKYIPKKIANLDEYVPNKGKYTIRLDANECPFEPSPEMKNEIQSAISNIEFNRYPDPLAEPLLKEISHAYGIPIDDLVVGNGSDELISLICGGFSEPGDVVTVAVPDFSMYEFYSSLSGATVVKFKKEGSNDIDLDELADFSNKNRSKILIFSNPCNPTGQCKSAAEIADFAKKTDAIVVVDEAYNEFCSFESSIFNKVEDFDNVIVLKTLSKAYGMAAIRLGIAASNSDLISAIRKIKSPYNVNSITQEIARIAVSHRAEIEARAKLISMETQKMFNFFKQLNTKYIENVYQTEANFILVRMVSSESTVKLTKMLKNCGIAIRCFEADKCIRISSGTPDENKILMQNIVKILKEMEN